MFLPYTVSLIIDDKFLTSYKNYEEVSSFQLGVFICKRPTVCKHCNVNSVIIGVTVLSPGFEQGPPIVMDLNPDPATQWVLISELP
jgi:hypothetical protein